MIGSFIIPSPVFRYGATPQRGKLSVWSDDWSRESINPTGSPTLYTVNETGAAGTSAIDSTVNRLLLTTDGTGAGDDQDARTSGLRIDRNYLSLITGMTFADQQTTSVQLDLPFSVTNATNIEGFVGLLAGTAITALPTTARHVGIYWDISAGANFMLTSANGTTQVTTDTTIPVDTSIHMLRINWTAEDVATLQLVTAAGANEGTGQTVAAFNGTTGQSYEIHWFVQTETNAAKVMRVYPYRVQWQ